jgi:hypothetical protein
MTEVQLFGITTVSFYVDMVVALMYMWLSGYEHRYPIASIQPSMISFSIWLSFSRA